MLHTPAKLFSLNTQLVRFASVICSSTTPQLLRLQDDETIASFPAHSSPAPPQSVMAVSFTVHELWRLTTTAEPQERRRVHFDILIEQNSASAMICSCVVSTVTDSMIMLQWWLETIPLPPQPLISAFVKQTMLPSKQDTPVRQFSTTALLTEHRPVEPINTSPLPEQRSTRQNLIFASPPHSRMPSEQRTESIEDAVHELSDSLKERDGA